MLFTHYLNRILHYNLLNKIKREFRQKDKFKKEGLGKAQIKMILAYNQIQSGLAFPTSLSNYSNSESDCQLDLTSTISLKKCGE